MQPQFQYDPDIGYRFVPNLKTRIVTSEGGYLVQTNSLGFRCRHEFDDRPTGVPRILLFGDSFTAGDNVSNGQRFGDLLEAILEPLEIYNFALPGTAADQHFIVYQKFARNLPRQAVVIVVLVENIRRITSAYRAYSDADGRHFLLAKPYFELDSGRLLRRFDPVPREMLDPNAVGDDDSVDRGGRFQGLRMLVRALGLQEAMQRMTQYQPTPEYDSADDPAWRLMRAILMEWRALLSCPVVLMPLPLYQHVEQTADASAYRMRFRELASDGDFILHDPLDNLWSYDAAARRGFRFKWDPHLTAAGHMAVARSLSPTLAEVLTNQETVRVPA